MATETCSTCKFFKVDDQLADFVDRDGWCLRFPPHFLYVDQQTHRQLTRFGTTMAEWWCGEHKPGPFPAT